MGGKHGIKKVIDKAEVIRISQKVADWLGVPVTIGGSHARGAETSGDIDLLIRGTVDSFEKDLVTVFGRCKNQKPKRIGLIDGVQVDLNFATDEYYGASLLAIRGDAMFNVGMRSIAKKQGMKLSQYGLFDAAGMRIAGKTEESIFDALGVQYVKKKHRNGIDMAYKAYKGNYIAWAIEKEKTDAGKSRWE